VIASKSYANQAIALELKAKAATGPVVIMQNGVGVEQAFLDAQFSPIYRCVLYVTSQGTSAYDFTFRPVTASPIGIVIGDESGLQQCVENLTTEAIINSVFNSICPLLDVDNGIFVRDESIAALAREVIGECVVLTERLNLGLSEQEIMEQVLRISQRSDGQLISTLQDMRNGRPTEIEFLNLAIARVAASQHPQLQLPRTELLGKLIVAKSSQQRRTEPQAIGQR
jgi:2-dehydropantoate 2-reductase